MTYSRRRGDPVSASIPWPQTPAFADLVATLAEMGLTCDPNPKTGEDWPSPDSMVCKRFHERWQERMQRRANINPFPGTPDKTGGTSGRRNRVEGIQKHFANADTCTNALLEILPDEPAGAMTANQLVERLNLPRGAGIANRVSAALSHLHRKGTVARRVDKRHKGLGRAGYAYYRRAA